MSKLSVIVPVYNSERYLKRTIEALLGQTVSLNEIILVDDGSVDNSPTICDEYADKYDNVICIHTQNGGPGMARNIGIEAARGEYIGFCDADDVPSVNMYESLLFGMQQNDADLCLCDMYSERDGKSFGFPWDDNCLFAHQSVISSFMASMLGNMSDDDKTIPVWGSSVRSLYKKEILEHFNIRFPENLSFAEDLVFNLRYISHIESVYIINEVLYTYTFNADSLMNSHIRYKPDMFCERLLLIEDVLSIIEPIDESGELTTRFLTSQRCYFHDCIGNAARAAKQMGNRFSLRKIQEVLNHPKVISAFSKLTVKDKRKRIIYKLIQKRAALVLWVYYFLRLC